MTTAPPETEPVVAGDPAVVGGEAHGELYPPGGQAMYELQFIPWLVGIGLVIGLLVIGLIALRRTPRRRR